MSSQSKDNTCPTCRGFGAIPDNTALLHEQPTHKDCPDCHGSGQQEDKPLTRTEYYEANPPKPEDQLKGIATDSKPSKPLVPLDKLIEVAPAEYGIPVKQEKPLECENCNSTRLVNESVVHNCLDCGYIWSDDRKPPPKEVLARLHKKATQALSSATSSGNTTEPKPKEPDQRELLATFCILYNNPYGNKEAILDQLQALLATEYDRGVQVGYKKGLEQNHPYFNQRKAEYDRGKVEVLKRVALEVDANVCECGRPWSETDLYDYVHGELKEGSKDAQA